MRLLLSTIVFAALAISPSAAQDPADQQVHDNNQFAFDLYAQLRGEKQGNLILSPYSISSALAMTYGGARGDTATQMADVMHFTQGDDTHRAFGELMSRLNASAGDDRPYELAIANALWGQQGNTWLPEFLALSQRHYGAGLREVDFAQASEAARKEINAWVSEQTQGKIPELFAVGTINPLTRLALTNAIYFKGTWVRKFTASATRKRPFTRADGEKVEADLMSTAGDFPYARHDDFLMLEMPYQGEDLAMLVLLPKQADGLAALEEQLSADRLAEWVKGMRATDLEVMFPKFTINADFSLKDSLSDLGMTDAFLPGKANFSGLTGNTDLFIATAVHQAYVEVNEEGTTAAAATGIGANLPAPVPQLFKADRPFLFMIRSVKDGNILFLGRVMDPTK